MSHIYPIKISELIKELQEALERLGDVGVYTNGLSNIIPVEGLIETSVDEDGDETDLNNPNSIPAIIVD